MSLTLAPASDAAVASVSTGRSETPPPSDRALDSAGRDRAPDPAGRDRALDLVRFACLVVVVVLHAMMSSAVLGPGGEVVPTVALTGTTGFAIASWGFQIMPLFFLIGGFVALRQWRRTAARGGTWADYLRVRLRRLVAPVTLLVLGAGTALAVASEFGVPDGLLAEASRRIGQPLWFLAVYVGLTSLVPLAVRFHDRSPRRSLLALAGAVAAVDALVAATGMTGFGYLNLLFVWPLVQQLGFVYADLRGRPIHVGRVVGVLIAVLALLVWLVAEGIYSPDMLVNLNPPTGALVLLGVVQMCVLRLLHDRLAAAVTGVVVWERVIAWGNRFGMHVYLWHMSVAIGIIGLLGALAGTLAGDAAGFGTWLSTLVLPEIGSPWWWATRPVWVLAVVAGGALLATGMAKVEAPGEQRSARWGRAVVGLARGRWVRVAASERNRACTAVGLAVIGIAVALLVGIAPLVWTLVSGGALILSLVLAAGLGERQPDSAFDETGERLGDGAPPFEEPELLMPGPLFGAGVPDDRAVVGAELAVAEDDLRRHRHRVGLRRMPGAADGIGEHEARVLLDAEEDRVDVRSEGLAVLAHPGDERAAGAEVERGDAEDERGGDPPLDELRRIGPCRPDSLARGADDAFDHEVAVGVDAGVEVGVGAEFEVRGRGHGVSLGCG